ncbi:alpha/beta fold hydrolase [Streptomyces smyrnaeus]|uniref:Alpha/beta fold hydrolase n=1 Tax=Streptomyces smyrnaeus TaxID=1387713 RepID=A0ABS3Y046_9ACTN|nr:alpha/beta fold hydrolase [Streptomyces smyrnaeus]MBO8200964.1 alpha/beta fold hydrolase [Streptomyces smyrnaeus]
MSRFPSPFRALLALAVLLASALTLPAASAQPNQRHAHRPIIFVHGYKSNSGVWDSMVSYAERYGYKSDELYRFDYRNKTPGNTSITTLGRDLRDFIKDRERNILGKSPDGKVDIIAHSMGGLVARAYLKGYEGTKVTKHFVSMGSPHHGTKAADLGSNYGYCDATSDHQCKEMTTTSPFIKWLNSGGETPGPTKYLTLRSNVGDEPTVLGMCDLTVFEGETSALAGATNYVTECIPHGSFYHDDWTRERSMEFLQDGSHTPKIVKTSCSPLEKKSRNSVEAWVQTCLLARPNKDKGTDVHPEIRIRGCGSFTPIWGYAGKGKNCLLLGQFELRKNGKDYNRGQAQEMKEARAFNFLSWNGGWADTSATFSDEWEFSFTVGKNNTGQWEGWRTPPLQV